MVIGGLLTVIALNVQLRDPAADRQWSPMTDHCPALHCTGGNINSGPSRTATMQRTIRL